MTQAAPLAVKKSTVTVTFNGIDREISYNRSAPVQVLLNHAKQAFGVQSSHLLSLFTEDGILARPSQPDKLLTGRAEILASLRSRPPRLTRFDQLVRLDNRP